jgi:hypothetical protein
MIEPTEIPAVLQRPEMVVDQFPFPRLITLPTVPVTDRMILVIAPGIGAVPPDEVNVMVVVVKPVTV